MPSPEPFNPSMEFVAPDQETQVQQAEVPEHHFEQKEIVGEDGASYTEYQYQLKEGSVSLIFKNEELFPDQKLIEGRQAVVIGEMPYTADGEEIAKRQKQTGRNTLYRNPSSYRRPYHFSTVFGWSDEFRVTGRAQEFGAKVSPDFIPAQLERLQAEAKDDGLAFIINTDIETITYGVDLLEKTFPELRLGESKLNPKDIAHLEDLVAAQSIGPDGLLQENTSEARRLIVEALLGNQASADALEKAWEKQKEHLPSFSLYRLEQKKEELEYLIEHEGKSASAQEHVAVWKKRITELTEMAEKLRRGETITPSPELLKTLDQHVAIHMTDYPPTFDEESGRWIILPHSQATGDRVGRTSVHFAVDGVAQHASITVGDWDNKRYAIIAPLGSMVKENGIMTSFQPADTYWLLDPNQAGVRLPAEATVLENKGRADDLEQIPELEKKVDFGKATSEERMAFETKTGLVDHQLEVDYANSLKNKAENERQKKLHTTEIHTPMTSAIRRFVKELYHVDFKPVGNEGWSTMNGDIDERNLADAIDKEFPFIYTRTRHSSTAPKIFEKVVVDYYNTALVGRHPDKLKSAFEKMDITDKDLKRDYVEFVTNLPPGKLNEETRQGVIDYLNNWTRPIVAEKLTNWQKQLPREFVRHLVKMGVL